MSITSRINEMSSHIEQAYDELQGLGADLTNVNKNIENISMVLDDIYDSMPQVSGEGTSLTLDDTRVGKIKSTLKGNTSQDGTPTPTTPIPVNVVSGDNEINVVGKNLLNYVGNLNANYGGLTSVINENGSITTTGKPTSGYVPIIHLDITNILENGATYTLSMGTPQVKKLYLQINILDNNGGATQYVSLNTSSSATFTANTNGKTYWLNLQTGTTSDWGNDSLTITNTYQLEKSNTKTDFEPYQGNTYNIDLPVENLWGGFSNSFSRTDLGVQFTANQDGTITANGTATNTATSILLSEATSNGIYKTLQKGTYTVSGGGAKYNVEVYDKNNVVRLGGIAVNESKVSFTINEETQIVLRIQVASGVTINETIKLQLEKSTKANSYTPYGTTPIELCKIGNYQDYFYKDSGKWYLHKEIGKAIADGDEYITIYNYNTARTVFMIRDFLIGVEEYTDSAIIPNLLSNRFIKAAQNATWVVGSISRRNIVAEREILYVTYEPDTSIDNFKTWLASNNLTCYYIYATPTITEITYQPLIDQLNELEKAMSKDGQTNISQVNNDLPFIISASALKEWQENASLNSTLSMVNPLSLGNTLNTQENNTQPIEVDNIEPLEEEENEES